MSVPDFSLAGQVAIVTGGKRGIGKSIALAFAEAGADVAVCGRAFEDGELKAVAREIQRLGRRSLAIKADTSHKVEVDAMVQKVLAEFGTIDILVNNAGIVNVAPLLDMSEADFDEVINIDLKGFYLCAQSAGKIMVERKKGNIINIASIFAFKVVPIRGAYSIAKAGVVMLTRVLARELGAYGIRANAIAPGMVRTEFSRDGWTNPEMLKRANSETPLGRIAETDDIVGAALFLASDASSYVTGHTIVVDGGRTL